MAVFSQTIYQRYTTITETTITESHNLRNNPRRGHSFPPTMSIQQSSTGLVQYSSSRRPSLHRQHGLKKLGVSEDDVFLAERLLEQISSCSISKSERILGYAASRLNREKAIRLLGATEDEVAVEIPKVLGTLGVAGRRRSYSTTDVAPPLHSSSKTGGDRAPTPTRRRSVPRLSFPRCAVRQRAATIRGHHGVAANPTYGDCGTRPSPRRTRSRR